MLFRSLRDSKIYPKADENPRAFSCISCPIFLESLSHGSGDGSPPWKDCISRLPEENMLPKSYYEAKKILCSMGFEYQKIHACPNDCILYRDEFEEIHKCPKCGVSLYKVKDDECSSDESIKKHPRTKVMVSSYYSKV